MKKKAIYIVSAIIVVIMLAGIIIPMTTKDTAGESTGNDSKTASIEGVEESTEPTGGDDASDDDAKEDKESGKKKKKSDSSSDDDSSSEGGTGIPGSFGGFSGDSDADDTLQESDGQASTADTGESTSSIPTISFPYAIPGTDLVVEKVQSYDGIFIEDGQDGETKGIATLVLTNNGGNLEFAGIGISQGARSLGFSASQIPAGATVIIQEQNKASYSSDPYYSATATTTPVEEFEMSKKLVTVKDNGDHSLSVTNISGKKLSEVKISFKNYLPDEDVYVGGITYNITLKDLGPNTSTTVSASHYDSEYSVVMEVSAKQ